MFIHLRLKNNKFNLILIFLLINFHCGFSVILESPFDCINKFDNGFAHYFDSTILGCRKCSQNVTFQKASLNGLSCECVKGHKTAVNQGKNITCLKCPPSSVVSQDRRLCVHCDTPSSSSSFNASTLQCSCPSSSYTQTIDFTSAPPRLKCNNCPPSTKPSLNKLQCQRCVQEANSVYSCVCKHGRASDGLCYQSEEAFESQLYTIEYMETELTSLYLRRNARKVVDRCGNSKHDEAEACESLANMCLSLLLNPNHPLCNKLSQRRGSVPSLNYNKPNKASTGTKTESTFTDVQITHTYTFPHSVLDVILQTTDVAGGYKGTYHATHHRHWLHFCKGVSSFLNTAFVFGSNFEQHCEVDVNELYDRTMHPPFYFEAFVQYEEEEVTQYARVPVFIDENAQAVNRFFMVENTIGDQGDGAVHDIMYAASFEMKVRLRRDAGAGRIFTPHININYKSLSLKDKNSSAPVSFRVTYQMDHSVDERNVWIGVGVLAALAVVLGGLETWGEVKRGGSEHLCCFYFVFSLCNHLSTAIFVVLVASSLWTLIFYKNQREVIQLVHDGLEGSYFLVLLILAFVLKLVVILRLIFLQVTADVFLIDWESSGKTQEDNRRVSSLANQLTARRLPPMETPASTFQEASKQPPSHPSPSSFPSVWRMYLVANEWNEIQSHRRVDGLVQLLCCILLLDVIGLGNLASMDPKKIVTPTSFPPYHDVNTHSSHHSYLLRFAWICVVYLGVAAVQALVTTPIYERFFEDKVGQIVDLCCTCNVSLMLLTSRYHGHYVHGRTVHGKSDVGLRQMHENFAKEEKDLVSKRGLLPGEDQQTFELAISPKLRVNIDKIIAPVFNDTRFQHTVASQHLDRRVERSIQSHYVLNQLLKAFVDHLLEDEEYTVKRKSLAESLFGFEGNNSCNTFYYDNGHSFDQCLLYGHEGCLVLFEVLLCSCVDLLSRHYTLSLLVSFLVVAFLKRARDSFGKRNLAIKTMVDKRFLI